MDFPKLQVLVYLAHGWHLALTGKPLVNEPFYAWRTCWFRAPITPTLLTEFNRYGLVGLIPGKVPGYSLFQADERSYAKKIMTRLWKLYGDRQGIHMIPMTRGEDSPYLQYVETQDVPIHQIKIPNEAIRVYFEPRMSVKSEKDVQKAVARRATWYEQLWDWATGR